MISLETLLNDSSTLLREDVERWIKNDLIRPATQIDTYAFDEIDIARVNLIQQLRDDLQVNEEALPIVLSLLDQLHDERRRLSRLIAALDTLPEDLRRQIVQHRSQNNGS